MNMYKLKIERLCGRVFAVASFLIIGLCAPLSSQAAGIGFTGPFLTCSISYNPVTGWSFSVDPENVQAFQLDIRFDPTRLAFTGIDYVSPYAQTTPPDLGNLSLGWVKNIAGASLTFPPPAGDVDLFTAHFTDLNPILGAEGIQFTVLAQGDDFLLGIDPTTGLTTRYGASMIEPMTCRPVPEPSTYGLVGMLGLMGIAAVRRFRRSRQM